MQAKGGNLWKETILPPHPYPHEIPKGGALQLVPMLHAKGRRPVPVDTVPSERHHGVRQTNMKSTLKLGGGWRNKMKQ